MNVLIVLGHPKPGSFNHAIAEQAVATLRKNGHEAVFHDLYQEHFDPILPYAEIRRGATLDPTIAQHCRELSSCDGLVVVHPNWWGQPPAILTGWIDRVFRAGVAYEFATGDSGEGVPRPLLRAGTAVVFNTTDTAAERELAEFGDPLATIWRNCILRYCGINEVVRKSYGIVVTSTEQQRRAWLDDVRTQIAQAFPSGA